MKKLSFAILFVCLGMFAVGCGSDDSSTEQGASNTGTGAGGVDAEEDPDAGVGTDPELMDPKGGGE